MSLNIGLRSGHKEKYLFQACGPAKRDGEISSKEPSYV